MTVPANTAELIERLKESLSSPFGHYAGDPEGSLTLVSTADATALLEALADCRAALTKYHTALINRQNGNSAAFTLVDDMETLFDVSFDQARDQALGVAS
jgi:hypothetical protein